MTPIPNLAPSALPVDAAEGVQHPLEPSGAEMRRLVEAALARIVSHVESLPSQPSLAVEGAVELARSLAEPLPEVGTPLPALLDLLFDRAIPASFNAAGPGYLAYIPGGGLFHAAVADLIADAVNRYTGVFAAAPALSQLEANVVAWLAEIVGYPREARGFLTSGGSLANWTALVTARRERLPENFLSGVLYASGETHHSVQKAALLAGFPPGNVRRLPTDERFRILPPALEEAIVADRRQGLTPFLVVGNAGTTNTGAVDPLAELAAIARRHGLWFHVDAAYGGFFLLTEEGRRVMRGIEQADSIVLDPHKGLFLPYGTGALLVQDGAALKRAHTVPADYMPPIQEDPDLVDFCEISPELSKPFRGLRVWLPVKLLGIAPFRAALEEKLALTRWATEALRAIPGIEILAEPQLSIVAFRLHPPAWKDLPAAERNRRNRELLDRINARKRVMLTGTLLGDCFALRICVVSFRTHQDRMEACLADIRAAVLEMTEMTGIDG
ncbi:MAG TPA: aminotransferase class I/II-fold pyridoxal phosphate-dependent enzyme [Thermoanaerobaculia bacterium]|nr:aminotransferase class I/II-fold pyridoxal phosphate-dependent enzyme [Thermoanaerobaculia bacterium]